MVETSRRFIMGAALAAGAGFMGAKAAGAPIRIGCVTALTGPQEVIGRPILTGAQIAADQINAAGGVLGRMIEIVPANAQADPAVAVTVTRKLFADGVKLLCGCVTSDVALAVVPLLQPADALLIGSSAQSDKLTHEAFTPNFFRVTDQAVMRNRAQARLMAERYPDVVRWGAIIPNVEYGRSAYAAFRDGLLEHYPARAGHEATLAAPILAEFGATDFRAQIAALKEAGAEGLFVAVYGGDAIAFYQQARRAGLFQNVRVLADSYNEFLVPMALGASTPRDLWLATTWYYGGYQGLPIGRALFDDNMRRTGNAMPLGYLEAGHASVLAYAAGISKAGGDATGPLIRAMEGLGVDTAKGRVTFRPEDHQAVGDVNFIRVRSSDQEAALSMPEGTRHDVEVAEFVRFDGKDVIEPATPGKPVAYRAEVQASR